MTVREKLGQLLMPYYFGVFESSESSAYKDLLHQVEANHVGGFILGTIRGPFVAAMLLGISDTAFKYLLPEFGAFFIYALTMAVLLWRPRGLFGQA